MSQYSRELTEAKAQHERTKRLLEQLAQGARNDAYLRDIADEQAKTDDRVRADEAFGVWARTAPAPRHTETRDEYRARLCHRAAHFLPVDHELRGVDVTGLSGKATGIFFDKFMKELKAAATDADTVPRGTLRRIEERGPTGHSRVSYVGPRSFVDDFHRPNRRVIGWGDGDPLGAHTGALSRANRLLAG
jgi:hypothetical protein